MRIAFLGTKGIPGHHGVEVVVDSLSPILASLGHEITVYGYDTYTKAGQLLPRRSHQNGSRFLSQPI